MQFSEDKDQIKKIKVWKLKNKLRKPIIENDCAPDEPQKKIYTYREEIGQTHVHTPEIKLPFWYGTLKKRSKGNLFYYFA